MEEQKLYDVEWQEIISGTYINQQKTGLTPKEATDIADTLTERGIVVDIVER
jgi:hypothetical protein